MPFRLPVTVNNSGVERGTPASIGLGAGRVETIGMTPKSSNGRSIVGMLFRIDAEITQATAQSFNVGQLFGGMRIVKGGNSNVRMAIDGYDQLVRLFNSLTRLTDAATDYFNNPTNTGAVGTTSQSMTFFLPLEYRTDDVIPQTVLAFNPVGTVGASSGNVTCTISYYYSDNTVRDDVINVVTTPTPLNSNTNIDVSTFFAGSTVQDEVWMDSGADANLNHQTFRMGNTPVFPEVGEFALRAHTNPAVVTQKIDGFFLMKAPVTAFPANGVDGQKPILDVNFATTVTPTFYLYSKL